MNYIHLSPHFPSNYYLFSVHLARLGVQVLGLADETHDRLPPALRDVLAEYYRVDDMHSYDQLLRACGHFTHRHGKLDRVDSHVEYWMDSEARLREDFNIAGPRPSDLAVIKRKSRMKDVFQAAGVPAARGELAPTIEHARRLIAEIGYPVVAKPDIGVGAANTFKLGSDAELEGFFASKPPVDYLIEEFIAGKISTFDGLTDKDGNPVFYSSLEYNQGVMEIVNQDLDLYYYTVRDLAPDLVDAGRRVLKAFGVRERFFHFEFFRTHDAGRLIALEVNMRPPGGPTLDMYNYAHDIDLYWEWANVVVNNRFEEEYGRGYHCCYIGRKFNRSYAHSHEEILRSLGGLIVHHHPVSSAFSLAMGNYAYLVRTPDREEMLAAASFIQELG
jgi:hypothetical protein